MKLKNKVFFATFLIIIISAVSVFLYVRSSILRDRLMYPTEYGKIVEKYSKEYNVKPEIIYATIRCESNFSPDVSSNKGAVGLMQITPATFVWLCSKTHEDSEKLDLFDPETNIKYGTFFLSMLYEEFGDPKIAHAAYNAGRGRIKEWLKSEEYYKDGELYYIPYAETREYVEKIIQATYKYKNVLEIENG